MWRAYEDVLGEGRNVPEWGTKESTEKKMKNVCYHWCGHLGHSTKKSPIIPFFAHLAPLVFPSINSFYFPLFFFASSSLFFFFYLSPLPHPLSSIRLIHPRICGSPHMIMSTSNTSLPSPLASTQSRRHHKKPYKSWLKDGVNGGPCSMQIVVQWLSANYAAKWRDDSDNRMPKKLLLQEILDQMRQAGIHHRLAKDVASKISTLQSNYRVAREWYDVIGSQWRKAGAQETDVKKEVLRRFPYWDELHAAFGATTGLNNSNPSTGGTITTTTTTTTTTTIGGNVASTSKMTTMTTHDKDIAGWPMSIRSIIHSIDEEANMTIPSLSSWFSSTEQVIEREQQEQAVATATVAAATAQATATNATATTARVISLSENSQTVIVSTATTTDIATEPKDTAPVALGKRLRVNDEEEESDEIDDDDESDEFEDDNDNGQALIAEKEKTRRVRVRADLVKRLMNLGRSKEEIATELKSCV